jgi:2-hydroxychromene-2-carboxylate isomerase/N-acetylglutamate synthase-like GNAT family acetyltransferase
LPSVQQVLYIDLNSPYAYLAAERAAHVLGHEPELQPILLGGIFQRRGWGSWAHTDEREQRLDDLAQRAERAGLPPLVYPEGWPLNGLTTMRAAIWAQRHGKVREFALEVFRRQFRDGLDLSSVEALEPAANAVGLEGVAEAVQDPAIKGALREATDAAWNRGLRGIPTLIAGDQVYFGDDRLELVGYEVSTDKDRLDVDYIAAFLATSYWAATRPREIIERSIANSLCFGLYTPAGAQCGFARAVTDQATYAYLADVFVDDSQRGKGLGVWLVERILEHSDLQTVGWVLQTTDAHRLYAKFGFVAPEHPERTLYRPRR